MGDAWLVVRAADRRFAIAVDTIKEICDRTPVTLLPRLPPAMPGVVDLHGRAVPVIDLGVLAGDAPRHQRRSLVLVSDGRRPMAFLIDDVEGIEDGTELPANVALLDVNTLLERVG